MATIWNGLKAAFNFLYGMLFADPGELARVPLWVRRAYIMLLPITFPAFLAALMLVMLLMFPVALLGTMVRIIADVWGGR